MRCGKRAICVQQASPSTSTGLPLTVGAGNHALQSLPEHLDSPSITPLSLLSFPRKTWEVTLEYGRGGAPRGGGRAQAPRRALVLRPFRSSVVLVLERPRVCVPLRTRRHPQSRVKRQRREHPADHVM